MERTIIRLLSIVAVDKTSGCQPTFFRRHDDAVHGSEESGVVGRYEEYERGDEDRGVEEIAALVALDKATKVMTVT
jgi:hypothetical protein